MSLQLPRELIVGGVTGRGSAGGVSSTAGIGTFASQMAKSTEATAETARDSARTAFTLGRLAFHDALTRLPKRRAFEHRFLELLESVDAGPDLQAAIKLERLDHLHTFEVVAT